ncbi:MAG: M23 family metallopeptidase [Erythrobacter sp.]|nr:M23 family metallopeptidase [Erythrobacter sp.]
MSDRTDRIALKQRIQNWFPDRELFMRSHGQVRFIKVSSRLQMSAAAAVSALALGWAVSMTVMAWKQYSAQADLASFQQEKAAVAKSQERLDAYGDDLKQVAEDLVRRQETLEAFTQMLPEDIRAIETNVTDSSAETAATVRKVSALFPHAAGLAEVEARQLAFVESMTRFADWRAGRAEKALRQLSLDPRAISDRAANGASAMGGPLEVLATAADGSLDPRFERLGLSLARMSALERALEGVPQVVPSATGRMTSTFGYRRDPFNGRGAMHHGLDYGGPIGSPVYAAATGTVSYVGWRSGYGKTVEIRHGNGVMTRYAHLSRFDVALGDEVEAGETIAGLGNTGRSSGPHLHFEVRINDRAVNPRTFLETAPDVLKEARRTGAPRTLAARGDTPSPR